MSKIPDEAFRDTIGTIDEEGHRKFIDQTVQTVDHMLYGIRQRIALEDYLRGSTIK